MATISIIGGGPAGLMAADWLSQSGQHTITVYEKGKVVGRKFLVAGKGGFNLSHAIAGDELYNKYHPSELLKPCLKAFGPEDTRRWLDVLGIPTFIGSSGRIFPEKGIKPAAVLKSIKDRLSQQGVDIRLHHSFIRFEEEGIPMVSHNGHDFLIPSDYYIFALGGASWSKTGSDGLWLKAFKDFGVNVRDFEASNCGINVDFTPDFITPFAGTPLKNIRIQVGDFNIKGEVTMTSYGLEGNAIYPCSSYIRKSLSENKKTYIQLDLKPNNSLDELIQKVNQKNIKPKNYKYIFNLEKSHIQLIKQFTDKDTFITPILFTKALKNLKIPVLSLRPIEEAISTVGGIDIQEIRADFSLKKQGNIFITGEMLDWDAPTGGFLLQGCFSMAHAVANTILKQLNHG